jgi:tetratricopeptide (TPR) repeat protein
MFYRAEDYCGENLLERAEILKYIGHVNAKQLNYSAAQSHYRESIALYSAHNESGEVAHLYLCLGFNAFEMGDYNSAEENYQTALEVAEELEGAEQILGDANLALAILATVKGDLQTARERYEKGVALYEAIGDERGLSQAYYNLGLLYVDIKEWVKAGEAYRKSLEYAQKYSDLHLIGLIHLSNTELALQLSDLAIAQASCMQAVRVFGRLGCQAQLAEAYKYSGQIHRRKRAWDKAERLFQKSIEFAAACKSHLNQAEAHYEYGLMLLDKQELQRAQEQLTKALEIFTRLEAKADIQKTQEALKQFDEETGEPTKMKPRFRRIQR